MIKALLLILFPIHTWERIATAQRRVVPILLTHLLPLLVLGSLAEGYGMVHWGKARGEVSYIKLIPVPETVVYQIVRRNVSWTAHISTGVHRRGVRPEPGFSDAHL
jgi:hypothetical protein